MALTCAAPSKPRQADMQGKTKLLMQLVNPKCGDEAVSLNAESMSSLPELKEGEVAYDARHPLYLSNWECSRPGVHNQLAIDDLDEPHLKRKLAILDKHPEIKQLYGHEWRTKYIVFALVSIQVANAYMYGKGPWANCHWAWFLAGIYLVGATITATFGVVIHEVTHNLAFKNHFYNRLLGFVINIGIVFPISASFRRYHLEHHAFQGVHGKDPDLPFELEFKLIQKSRILKLIWVFCFPVLYVARGAAMLKKPQKWEIANWVWTISCDLAIYHFCGIRGLLYMFLSLWFGYGLHIGSAHFIQEHYTFAEGQETFSYYGSGNVPMMNIGYHNEHHDFTQVPWTRLPQIREVASEFYDTLVYHTSWVKVIVDFIWREEIGPQSRLARTFEDHQIGRGTIRSARKMKQQ